MHVCHSCAPVHWQSARFSQTIIGSAETINVQLHAHWDEGVISATYRSVRDTLSERCQMSIVDVVLDRLC